MLFGFKMILDHDTTLIDRARIVNHGVGSATFLDLLLLLAYQSRLGPCLELVTMFLKTAVRIH